MIFILLVWCEWVWFTLTAPVCLQAASDLVPPLLSVRPQWTPHVCPQCCARGDHAAFNKILIHYPIYESEREDKRRRGGERKKKYRAIYIDLPLCLCLAELKTWNRHFTIPLRRKISIIMVPLPTPSMQDKEVHLCCS